MSIESYLQKIDLSLKSKSNKDIKLTYIMVVIIIFALSYFFLWDLSKNNFLSQNKQIISIKTKLNIDENYLATNTSIKTTALDNQIKKTQIKMLDFKDKNDYIKNKIGDISSLIYDEQTWGKHINSISLDAQKYDVIISEFNNEFSKNNGSFGHILDLSIKLSANFANTLMFINALEQNDLVVDIHNLNIKAQDELNTELKISVWGITY